MQTSLEIVSLWLDPDFLNPSLMSYGISTRGYPVTSLEIRHHKIFSKKKANRFGGITSPPETSIQPPFLRLFYQMRDGRIITTIAVVELLHRQRFLLSRQDHITIR